MLCQVLAQLNVELDQAEHSNSDANTLEHQRPNVGEERRKRGLAIDVELLSNDRHDREKHSNEAVLEDADPYYLRMSANYVNM